MCLATMAYVYAAHAGRVTIFSTGGKSCPISHFTELHHALTLTACSYVLLIQEMVWGLTLLGFSPEAKTFSTSLAPSSWRSCVMY